MNVVFQNIDEYISLQESVNQQRLKELRQIIVAIAPSETKEIISYQMPTFRYNGNLIHFAQFKNHIGIYPGPDAIVAHKDQLSGYKTSKGAIQIPNTIPLDKNLIESLIHFNVEQLKDKKGPNWDSYRDQWLDLYEKMSQLILKTNLTKEFKWGTDVYTFQGKNIIGWAGFKNFFSIWFYNGVFLTDPYQVLVNASEGKTKSLRQWRVKDNSDFDEKRILEYIQESIQTILDGKTIPIEKGSSKAPEGILKDELTNNKPFHEAFYKLTAGRQKEYIEYINEAKQDKTKIARLEKIIPTILSGKGLNDKYKR
ncbi:DUF1801 domain-containing protein [Sphingobacterium bovistauri]|uniref:DUF1801 domain-containing protein n=1 Tax=Sphingobacterium bovistauri TaxID=2781959 RepID=A0ABS7Z4P7_9SPHI|nr:DUF1801 domain-containing protein [Sphingobacterium bovistauri]MCA5005122.1 DUF1801 domain-containing protein [Sphingobacterium bovistauri]